MKKLALFFSILLLAGCQNTTKESDNNKIPMYVPSPEDVVAKIDEVENGERFKGFLNNIENGKKDTVRIVRYTTEGDAILHDLEYDEKVIQSVRDSSRDQYGSGKIVKAICTSVEVSESTEYTSYHLIGCDNNINYVLLESPKK